MLADGRRAMLGAVQKSIFRNVTKTNERRIRNAEDKRSERYHAGSGANPDFCPSVKKRVNAAVSIVHFDAIPMLLSGVIYVNDSLLTSRQW